MAIGKMGLRGTGLGAPLRNLPSPPTRFDHTVVAPFGLLRTPSCAGNGTVAAAGSSAHPALVASVTTYMLVSALPLWFACGAWPCRAARCPGRFRPSA